MAEAPMAKIVRLRPKSEVDAEAAAWLTRLDRGLSGDERHQFDTWMGEDPRHPAALMELAKAWDSLETLGALSGLVELPDREAVDARRRRRTAALVTAGLTIGLAALAGWRAYVVDTPRGSADVVTTTDEAALWSVSASTRIGERRVLDLPDGSRVSMNTQTRLAARQDSSSRRVELLAGEATFEVAHDPSHPFIVRAAETDIRAVGTVFTVRARSKDAVSVIVSEGRVAVTAASQPKRSDFGAPQGTGASARLLSAGERYDASRATVQTTRISSQRIADALAWQNGMIVFQGEPLTEALEEISRYTDVRFEIDDPTIGGMRVAGVFRVDDLQGFIAALQANLGVVATTGSDGTWTLSRVPTG
jgi:transmembrane sensor